MPRTIVDLSDFYQPAEEDRAEAPPIVDLSDFYQKPPTVRERARTAIQRGMSDATRAAGEVPGMIAALGERGPELPSVGSAWGDIVTPVGPPSDRPGLTDIARKGIEGIATGLGRYRPPRAPYGEGAPTFLRQDPAGSEFAGIAIHEPGKEEADAIESARLTAYEQASPTVVAELKRDQFNRGYDNAEAFDRITPSDAQVAGFQLALLRLASPGDLARMSMTPERMGELQAAFDKYPGKQLTGALAGTLTAFGMWPSLPTGAAWSLMPGTRYGKRVERFLRKKLASRAPYQISTTQPVLRKMGAAAGRGAAMGAMNVPILQAIEQIVHEDPIEVTELLVTSAKAAFALAFMQAGIAGLKGIFLKPGQQQQLQADWDKVQAKYGKPAIFAALDKHQRQVPLTASEREILNATNRFSSQYARMVRSMRGKRPKGPPRPISTQRAGPPRLIGGQVDDTLDTGRLGAVQPAEGQRREAQAPGRALQDTGLGREAGAPGAVVHAPQEVTVPTGRTIREVFGYHKATIAEVTHEGSAYRVFIEPNRAGSGGYGVRIQRKGERKTQQLLRTNTFDRESTLEELRSRVQPVLPADADVRWVSPVEALRVTQPRGPGKTLSDDLANILKSARQDFPKIRLTPAERRELRNGGIWIPPKFTTSAFGNGRSFDQLAQQVSAQYPGLGIRPDSSLADVVQKLYQGKVADFLPPEQARPEPTKAGELKEGEAFINVEGNREVVVDKRPDGTILTGDDRPRQHPPGEFVTEGEVRRASAAEEARAEEQVAKAFPPEAGDTSFDFGANVKPPAVVPVPPVSAATPPTIAGAAESIGSARVRGLAKQIETLPHYDSPSNAGELWTNNIKVQAPQVLAQMEAGTLTADAAFKQLKDMLQGVPDIGKPTEPIKNQQTLFPPTGELDLFGARPSGAGPRASVPSATEELGGRPGDPYTAEQQDSDERLVMELPELVALASKLQGGKLPQVLRKLRLRHGRAIGAFYPEGTVGTIKLKADIAIGPALAGASVKPKNVKAATDELMGIALQKIGELPEGKTVEDVLTVRTTRGRAGRVDITVYKIDPRYANKTVAHEIGHLVDWLPSRDLARGNILGRIATLRMYMKTLLREAPRSQFDIITKKERTELRNQAGREIRREMGPRPAKDNAADRDVWNKAVSERYAQLLREEIDARHLFTRDEIMGELKELSQWWKPFTPGDDAFTKYRYSPEELYADATSVLLNNPRELKARAPKFTEAFFNWLEKKPKAQATYDAIQAGIRVGAIERDRVRELRAGFRAADKNKGGKYEHKTLTRQATRTAAGELEVDEFYDIMRRTSQAVRQEADVTPGRRPDWAIEEARYANSTVELQMDYIGNEVIPILHTNGLSWPDLDEYLFHRRVVGERSQMFNPRGWTADRSQKRLDAMAVEFGPERFEALQAAQQAFWEFRNGFVLPRVRASGMYSEALEKKMLDNEVYATFDVAAFIDDRHGTGSSGHVYRQYGTLGDIAGPATATLEKDAAILRSIDWMIAKRAAADFLAEHGGPGAIEPAKTRWVQDHHELLEPRDPRKGLLAYLEGGKIKGFYVPRHIARSFARPYRSDPTYEISARLCTLLGKPFRFMFTQVNPGYWLFNAKRDFNRSVRNLPGASWSRLLPLYVTSLSDAWASTGQQLPEVVREMLENRELISYGDVRGSFEGDPHIERLLARFHESPGRWRISIRNPFRRFLMHALYNMKRISATVEREGKIVGHRYLKKYHPDMDPHELGHRVRSHASSPDFLAKGIVTPFSNSILLFSNPMVQGIRADVEVFRERPGETTRKIMQYTVLPKALMWAAGAGVVTWLARRLLGEDSEEAKWAGDLEYAMRGISEYDKTNYQCVPLGLLEDGRTIYLRVPVDENERFIGGMVWKTLAKQELDLDTLSGVFDYGAGQAPNLNPAIKISLALVEYLSGENPRDRFRNRSVIPEQTFKARGESWRHQRRALGGLFKWMANQGGMRPLMRFKTYDSDQKTLDGLLGVIEDLTNFPVTSDIVGRFIKISDYGHVEGAMKSVEEVRARRAGELQDIRAAYKKYKAGKALSPRERELLQSEKNSAYVSRLRGSRAGRGLEGWEGKAYGRAQTRKEREAVSEHIQTHKRSRE